MLTFEKHPLASLLWRRGKRCSLTQEDTLNAVPVAYPWIRKAPPCNVEETTGGRVEEHFQGWEKFKSREAGRAPCLLKSKEKREETGERERLLPASRLAFFHLDYNHSSRYSKRLLLERIPKQGWTLYDAYIKVNVFQTLKL